MQSVSVENHCVPSIALSGLGTETALPHGFSLSLVGLAVQHANGKMTARCAVFCRHFLHPFHAITKLYPHYLDWPIEGTRANAV